MSDRLILLVDTDSTDVDRLTQQLSAFGYGVDHCRNVSDIGERITAREPSVLLVRVDSGPTSGSETTIETVARILNDGDHKTPTIFLANDYDMKSRLAPISIGAKAFLVRPYSPLDLVDALDLLTEPQEEEPFRVLIVDNDERISEFYMIVLEQAVMQAMALSKPMKVLDVLSDFRPELVLMDQYMPEIEGRELGAVIRQEAAFLSIPIVPFGGKRSRRATGIDENWSGRVHHQTNQSGTPFRCRAHSRRTLPPIALDDAAGQPDRAREPNHDERTTQDRAIANAARKDVVGFCIDRPG